MGIATGEGNAPTTRIEGWIESIAWKRTSLRARRNRDLRAEAILANAHAEAARMLSDCIAADVGSSGSVLCDCDTCTLCQRHFFVGNSVCYCSQMLVDESRTAEGDASEPDDAMEDVCGIGQKFERFFAELDLATKRKKSPESSIDGGEKPAKRFRASSAA